MTHSLRIRLAAALVCASVCVGCPSPGESSSGESGKTSPAASPNAQPSPTARDTPPAPSPEPSGQPGPEPGPGPGPMPRQHPRPEDGVPGTSYLRTIRIDVDGSPLDVWVADTWPRIQLGLMHVTSMPEERGMLFVYKHAKRRSFWMRNTRIPLSLAYIAADGTIEQIEHMQPMSDKSYPSRKMCRLVLEVNQGWFERHGVKVGDKIPNISGLRGY